MGTSSPYGGRKDRNPLLPHDYDDSLFPSPGGDMPPPSPEKSNGPKEPPKEQKPPKDDDNKKQPEEDDKSKNVEKVNNPLKHETPWKNAKTSFSKNINGSSNNGISKTMQAYGRAFGSTKAIIYSSK
jgi:outer membrane biosynthesis protein TonB